MSRRAAHPVLFRGLAAALSLLLVAGLLEVALRTFRLVPDWASIRYREMPGDEAFAPLPEQVATSLYGVVYHTDELGLRAGGHSRRTAAATPVVLLGDSVAWGAGVGDGETIASRLAELAGATRPIAVWNLGVPAYDVYNERARFRRLAPQIEPRASVLVVLFNDLKDHPVRFRVTAGGEIALPGRRAPFPDSWRRVLERSALFHGLVRVYASFVRPPDAAARLRHLPALRDQIRGAGRDAEQVGSSLVVATMPGLWPPVDAYRSFASAVEDECRAAGLGYVDLARAVGSPPEERLFLPADSTHPTPEGARRIALTLLPVLRERLAEEASPRSHGEPGGPRDQRRGAGAVVEERSAAGGASRTGPDGTTRVSQSRS